MDLSATYRNCIAVIGLTLLIIFFKYKTNSPTVKLLEENDDNTNIFKNFNLEKSIETNNKRLQLYKSECENYYKEHKILGEFVKNKNYTSIFMAITKHPANYKEEAEIKALGRDSRGMNHRARSLNSLHTVDTRQKLGKDMIYCVPGKTGVSNWQRFNLLVKKSEDG